MRALERPEFRTLFLEQRVPLFRFLLRLTRNTSDAEDLLQETFLTVWRKRDRYDGRGSVEGFLRRTAYRLFLNADQRRRRRAALAPESRTQEVPRTPEEPETESAETLGFLVQRVQEALQDLPEPTRAAFLLFRFEGLTCAQVAETLDCPQRTVETRIARATQLLAQRLRPYRHHLAQ